MEKAYYKKTGSRQRSYYTGRRVNTHKNGKRLTAAKKSSSLLLRINICLGLTIIVTGIAKMNNDMSAEIYDYIKTAVSKNISAADIENEKTRLLYVLGVNKELVKLDEDVLQTIKNEAD